MKTYRIILSMAFLVLLLSGINAFSANYYIDCSGGSDSGGGTSEQSPWLHHPYMVGFTGHYNHAAGDQFYFKGGVTCPNSYFPLTVANGGSNGSPDYYGPDPAQAWFTGSSWTRPIFDLQVMAVGSADNVIDLTTNAPSWVTIDNFEIKGFYWDGSGSTCSFGMCNVIYAHSSGSNITLNHLYIHSWSHGSCTSGCDAGNIILGPNWAKGSNFSQGELTNVLQNSIIACPVGDGPCDGHSGRAAYSWAIIHDSVMHDLSNGFVGVNYQFYNNLVYNINNSYDPLDHENAYEGWGADPTPVYIYNNVFHDTDTGVFAMDINVPAFNGGGGSVYVFNNQMWNVNSSNGPVIADDNCMGGTSCQPQTTSYYIWSNTLHGYNGTGQCLLIEGTGRGPADIGLIDYRNNHCMTTNSTGWNLATGANPPNPSSPNVLMTPTTATQQGYTATEAFVFSPASGCTPQTCGTLQAGTTGPPAACSGALLPLCDDTTYGVTVGPGNVTISPARQPNQRSSSGLWDAGTYLYSTSSGPPNPPTALTAAVQ